MITIKYEVYYNDNNFSHRIWTLENLQAIKQWIYDKMHVREYSKWIRFNYNPSYITIQPDGPGMNIHIHQIEDSDGILFSDGEYTAGQNHCATCVKQWMTTFRAELEKPKFNFINK